MRIGSLVLVAAALAVFPVLAAAQPWCDGFDTYALGSGLHGQGGWHGWDGSPAADAYVSNLYARSVPHSVEVRPTSDIVHEYTGYTSGTWVFTAWQYIPSGTTGDQYFILLNTYNDLGPYNWSTELRCGGGLIESDPEALTLPLIYDQWVEIRVEIDLGADTQAIYYGGTLLSQKSWTQGLSGGGAVDIAAVDLYSNGAAAIYYDDLCLTGSAAPLTGACCLAGGCTVTTQAQCAGQYMGDGTDCDPNPCVVPTDKVSWGQIKAAYTR
jgi:hypothetical protein